MAYDVSALASYTKPNEKVMLTKSILAAKTVARIKVKGTVMTGVKGKTQLPSMDTDAVFQDGKGCGFTASGTTKVSTRSVEVGTIKVQEALCPQDFEDKFEQLNLTAGAEYTEALFAQEYSEIKSKKIAKALEVAVWQGDTASANVQLKRFDGFIKIIDAAIDEINGNTGAVTVATGITQSNVIAILNGVYNSFPEELIEDEDSEILVGASVLRLYRAALTAANLYHGETDTTPGEDVLHGTNMKISSTPGLNGTNRIFGINWKNMVFATDLLDETEKFELKYAPEAEEVRFSAKFKSGVQYAFTDEVVSFKLVP